MSCSCFNIIMYIMSSEKSNKIGVIWYINKIWSYMVYIVHGSKNQNDIVILNLLWSGVLKHVQRFDLLHPMRDQDL